MPTKPNRNAEIRAKRKICVYLPLGWQEINFSLVHKRKRKIAYPTQLYI